METRELTCIRCPIGCHITVELENGEVDLDTSIEKYTKAMSLVKSCDEKLKKIDEQVSKLVTENNTIEDFNVE